MRTTNGLWLAAIGLGIALIWGLDQVALAPLETGEVYPPYSSLRSDPQGTKALYESLDASGLAVERLYKERTVLENRGDALFVLGVDPIGWSAVKAKTLEEYEKLVERGGRLVIAFVPVRRTTMSLDKLPVEERWNIRLRYRRADANSLPRHETELYFEAGPQWRIDARIAERAFGEGTIVLVTDCFPLSNQGLRDTRDVDLITKLVGPSHRIIFDENHFGVSESGSVTKLMRKYRLEGAVAVLALVGALFVWRSASSFLPPRETSTTAAVTGRDSMDGMTSLLHRGVPEKNLLDVCFAEWSKSEGRQASQIDRVEEEIRRLGKQDPVAAYRAANRVLLRTAMEKK
jgi:uncharacterized protein DUF4350